ncbi:hypothetical protein L579_1210 [Pantoea sp. AS-PWVM4]|nr:hypothetical protein L579_1210 [Pantoea sp. AS-PWVM4]
MKWRGKYTCALYRDSAQKAMNRWLVPNKLTVQSYPQLLTDEY